MKRLSCRTDVDMQTGTLGNLSTFSFLSLMNKIDMCTFEDSCILMPFWHLLQIICIHWAIAYRVRWGPLAVCLLLCMMHLMLSLC